MRSIDSIGMGWNAKADWLDPHVFMWRRPNALSTSPYTAADYLILQS